MKRINTILGFLGYQSTSASAKSNKDGPGYVLFPYLKQNGSFDYEEYLQIQKEGNRRKVDKVWVIEENIEFLSDFIRRLVPNPQYGICHGTRRGKEQEWFRKYLGCNVIGTEISDTASTFPNTIQWDFHEVKPEWLDFFDFIYSNSFDHSYDPERCLNAWMSCVRHGGVCIIEHSSEHESQHARELDPFGADIQIMPYLITQWGQGKYGVRQLLEAPKKANGLDHCHFIVVQRF